MPDSRGNPVIYLDTNIVLDVIEERRPESVAAFELIARNQWEAYTSPFSILEILEAVQTDRWAAKLLAQGWTFSQVQARLRNRRTGPQRLTRRELNEIYVELNAKLSAILDVIILPQATPRLMDRAEDVCAATNIEATDSLHLATALEANCDLLVTADSDFGKLAGDYIVTVLPRNFGRAVEEFYRQT